jgi:hypothetical protein
MMPLQPDTAAPGMRMDQFSMTPDSRFSAAWAWRASRQIIGNPASVSACHSQVVRGPVSSPIRTASGACLRIVASIAAG